MKLYSDTFFYFLILVLFVVFVFDSNQPAEKVDLPGPKIQDRLEPCLTRPHYPCSIGEP